MIPEISKGNVVRDVGPSVGRRPGTEPRDSDANVPIRIALH